MFEDFEKLKNEPTDLLTVKLASLREQIQILSEKFNAPLSPRDARIELIIPLPDFRIAIFPVSAWSHIEEKVIKDFINNLSTNLCAEKNFILDELRNRAGQ